MTNDHVFMDSSGNSVQRINTKGGMAQGPCDGAGTYQRVPYSADYVFLANGS